jgi:hypothetical protein
MGNDDAAAYVRAVIKRTFTRFLIAASVPDVIAFYLFPLKSFENRTNKAAQQRSRVKGADNEENE